jgi:hypothetical protein
MRTAIGWAAGLLIGAVGLAGCGPEKRLPEKPAGTSEKAPPAAPKVPEQSDEAARAIVVKAIEAHTRGNPGRLQKARAHRLTMKGHIDVQGVMVPLTRRTAAEWPDRVRFESAFDAPNLQPVTLVLRGAESWRRGGLAKPEPVDPVTLEELRWDAAGLYWSAFLLPVADEAAVVYAPGEQAFDGRTLRTVRVALPRQPVWSVGFDPETGLLARVAFEGREAGLPRQKVFALADPQEYDGLLVPAKWDVFHGARRVETYRVESLRFVDTIDPKEFAEPDK